MSSYQIYLNLFAPAFLDMEYAQIEKAVFSQYLVCFFLVNFGFKGGSLYTFCFFLSSSYYLWIYERVHEVA